MSRIFVYETRRIHDDFGQMLSGEGHEIVVCNSREALFDQLTERRPDVLVYVLADLVVDLGVLTLLRRVAPKLPIILLGGPAGLEARRSVQELKPTYYAVFPLDTTELREAVDGALAHAGGTSGTLGHGTLGHGNPHGRTARP